jgi:hypothetical protein
MNKDLCFFSGVNYPERIASQQILWAFLAIVHAVTLPSFAAVEPTTATAQMVHV